MLLGVVSLETSEVVHGSLLSTSSQLLSPGSLLPLVIDVSGHESVLHFSRLGATLNRDDEVSEVKARYLGLSIPLLSPYTDLLSLYTSGGSIDQNLTRYTHATHPTLFPSIISTMVHNLPKLGP